MIITDEIKKICEHRAEVNANCTYDSPTEDDFKFEEATLRNAFVDAVSYCSECFATGDGTFKHHYLSCSFWSTMISPPSIKD